MIFGEPNSPALPSTNASEEMTKNEQNHAQLLSVGDVAKWLNVSSSLVYQLVESKRLAACRIGNGRGAIRFRPEDVQAYIASCVDRRMPINVATPSRSKLKHIKVRRDAS